MRGLYVFCIIALSASCAQITDEGFVDGSGAVAVSRIVNGGKLYGLKDRGKICTPLQFTNLRQCLTAKFIYILMIMCFISLTKQAEKW